MSFQKKKEEKFPVITEADKEWVELSFQMLMTIYGLPKKESTQILFNKEFFPKTFDSEPLSIPFLIEDLCDLLNMNTDKIQFELQKDITDIYGMPYAEDNINRSETEITENGYIIHIPNSLTKRPNGLLFSIIQEVIKINTIESGSGIEKEEDDLYSELFICMIGVYLGFGVIFCQSLIGGGYSTDGFWETKWNYISPMPKEVMTYALALHCGLIEEENFAWKEILHPTIKLQFEKAMEFLEKYPSSLLNPAELKAMRLIEESSQEYEKNKFDFAISLVSEALFFTENDITKVTIYSDLGYYQLRNGNFEESTISFEKVLEIQPDSGTMSDCLAYAYTKLGKLEEAKHCLEEAIATENNELAYHYRNVAVYYAAKGETEKAEEYFKLAFEEASYPVDLLEFEYANFLFNQEKTDEGMKYLQLAVKKNEPEAIQYFKKIS